MYSSTLILGIPGAGKTTVARALASSRRGTWISASTTLRDHSSTYPEIASRWGAYWSRGQMAPDEEVLPVLWDRYLVAVKEGAAILDGYPRTCAQLDDFCVRGGRINLAVLLELDDAAAAERLLLRKQVQQRVDDELLVLRDRTRQARADIKALCDDQRICSRLEVIDCTGFDEVKTMENVLEAYDSSMMGRPASGAVRSPTASA
jgi:adenylate kinase family enzyme